MQTKMSDSVTPSTGDDSLKPEPAGRSDRNRTSPTLRLAIVAYEDSSDRATITPPNQTGTRHLEKWLSVDTSLVVELSAWR